MNFVHAEVYVLSIHLLHIFYTFLHSKRILYFLSFYDIFVDSERKDKKRYFRIFKLELSREKHRNSR